VDHTIHWNDHRIERTLSAIHNRLLIVGEQKRSSTMTYVVLRMPTKRMNLKTIAKFLVISVVILAGSPAVATPIARDDAHCRISEQKAGAFHHQKFGRCISLKVDAPHWNGGNKTHDDWPANLILG